MSYGYEYVLRYTVDSNFDDVTVYDVLTEYLYDRYGIDFEIKYRKSTPLVCTDHPLSRDQLKKVEKLVNRATGRQR